MDPAQWLRDRADSYERDRIELRARGWTDFAQWFGTMRDELRACAEQIDQQ